MEDVEEVKTRKRFTKIDEGGEINMNKIVASGLIISAIIGVVGAVFAYDVNLSNALYTLAGLGLYIFGVWAAVILIKK